MTDRLFCPDCRREIIPVEGVTAIRDRDAWWCAHCVKIAFFRDGLPVVDFPSPGRLQPPTILTEHEEQ